MICCLVAPVTKLAFIIQLSERFLDFIFDRQSICCNLSKKYHLLCNLGFQISFHEELISSPILSIIYEIYVDLTENKLDLFDIQIILSIKSKFRYRSLLITTTSFVKNIIWFKAKSLPPWDKVRSQTLICRFEFGIDGDLIEMNLET